MTNRLYIDHENARYLANKLDRINGIEVDYNRLDINMVFIKFYKDYPDLLDYFKEEGILLGGYKDQFLRLVVHNDISIKNIDYLVSIFGKYFERKDI